MGTRPAFQEGLVDNIATYSLAVAGLIEGVARYYVKPFVENGLALAADKFNAYVGSIASKEKQL